MMSFFHPAVASLALFQSTQLNLFERFLTQAVSGIDSTSITSGMQNVAYVVLLIGFLWQVYQAAMHGGDVRGLGTNLIKYVVTAIVVMNYHAIFTTINQGFVDAGNWVNSASGAANLLDNWANDLKTQYSQVGFQNLWGLVTGSTAGILDAALIIVAYILYPVVIAIFGFFYILYGSVLYIFGPIVIALMPLGATNRLAKSYAENVFIWNAWPVLYGGFGALLSAVQMGQVGQMLNQNDFLGGLGNLEGSILIGLASIIYSLAIAVIPFIAKKIVSGDVGSTALALIGAGATAVTMGVAATEGAIAGASGGASAAQNRAGGAAASGTGSATSGTGSKGVGNQPVPQQRSAASGTGVRAAGESSGTSQTVGQAQAESIRGDFSKALARNTPPQGEASPLDRASDDGQAPTSTSEGGHLTQASRPNSGSAVSKASGRNHNANFRGPSPQLMRPHGLATWGAYHAARLATRGAVGGARSAASAVTATSRTIANPVETAGKVGAKAGSFAATAMNAVGKTTSAAGDVAGAVRHPQETVSAGIGAIGNAARAAASNVASTALKGAHAVKSNFSEAYDRARSGERKEDNESE